MRINKRVFLLIIIMVLTCIMVMGVSISNLYRTAFNEAKERLKETAQSQARLIESIAKFDKVYSTDYPDGSTSATLSQIIDAHSNYKGFGETGEFTLARREDDYIVFILRHRHSDLDNLKPVPIDSELAEPMRLALSGQSGTIVGLDYRGEKVLAAYEPVEVLNLGIVAKIDLAEIRSPFIHTIITSLCASFLFVILGTIMFLKVSNPIIRKIENHSKELEIINKKLASKIEQQHKTELSLQENERKYRLLVENANDAIFVTQNENIIFPNPKTEEITGYSLKELTKMHFTEFTHPEDREMIMKRYEQRLSGKNLPSNYVYRIIKKSGETVWVHINLVNLIWEDAPAILSFIRDITVFINLEKQLQQSQKMESIGNLAGGIAHDYNNVSSIILGYTELALDKLEPDDPLYDDISEILKAAKRSMNVTKQLLAFARKQTIAPKVLNLNDTVESILKMLSRLIGEDIDLAWIPRSDLWSIKIDPSQIDQILANLCVNSRDSLSGVGKITIETNNTSFDQDYCDIHSGFILGEYVLLSVSDNGSGINPEDMDKIFEPFFTTKEIGKGTGLGLATVYGIVKQNNGFINVYSELEKGTSIKIYLPRDTAKIEEVDNRETGETPKSQGEIVLLVEDDESILKMGEQILTKLGYDFLSANTPNKAIKLVKEHNGEIHLLVTDVIMPEMNGRDLAKSLKAYCPGLKILYMSGYTANVIAHHGVLEEGICFLQKPFSVNGFAHKVREALEKDYT